VVDVLAGGRCDPEPVLQIDFQHADPPEGWVRRFPGEDRLRFSGWLGLLQAISELAATECRDQMLSSPREKNI
jgi:hypothetical protein